MFLADLWTLLSGIPVFVEVMEMSIHEIFGLLKQELMENGYE